MFNHSLHRYACVLVGAVLVLLGAGGLVTGNDAGLSIPDWPLAYGRLVPPFVGNIRFEYVHRVIATTVGLLTIGLVMWLWRAEPRRWLRWLGVAALGCVVLQGVLGGLTVLRFQPPWLSAAHASVAQLFLLTVLSVAVFTGRIWIEDGHAEKRGTLVTANSLSAADRQRTHSPLVEAQESAPRPSIFSLGVITCAAIYLQLIVGAGYRHGAIGVAPHLVGACIVTALLLWWTGAVLARHRDLRVLRRPAVALFALLAAQLVLGVWSYELKIATRGAPQPEPRMVLITTIHLLCGAAILATSLLLTLRAQRWMISERGDSLATPAPQAARQAASL
jgi:cytochrome c oxidase assembly protein subunit 15